MVYSFTDPFRVVKHKIVNGNSPRTIFDFKLLVTECIITVPEVGLIEINFRPRL